MVKLPAQALTQLSQLRAELVSPGEIFWLPSRLIVFYESDRHERPCLVVAVDQARAHLVCGTTSRGGGSLRVVASPEETGLPRRTRFDFSLPFSLRLIDLVNSGRPVGCLDTARWSDVIAAVDSSRNVALHRLVLR